MIVRDQQAIRDGAGAVVTDAVERVTGARPVDFGAFVAGATWS